MKIYKLAICLLTCTLAFAGDIEYAGTIIKDIPLNQNKQGVKGQSTEVKRIQLLKLNLSDKAKQEIAKKANDTLNKKSSLTNVMPAKAGIYFNPKIYDSKR